jgi:hypothetical protein
MKIKNLMRLFLVSTLLFLFAACMQEEIPVILSAELTDKGVAMNSFTTEDSIVEIYLVCEDPIEGELLAKAINPSNLEISRAKVVMTLQKDDAKKFTFNFDEGLDLDQVSKYRIDLRKK